MSGMGASGVGNESDEDLKTDGDVQPWEMPPGKVTFPRQQTFYREAVWAFFKDEDRFARLHRIHEGGDELAALIFFYVKQYMKGRLVRGAPGITRMCDEYASAISSHKKRFYNFESRLGVRTGKDELIWGGEINPGVCANEGIDASVEMTLPRLVAMQWFVDHEYDKQLWQEQDAVRSEFVRYTTEIKRLYTSTHKQKKRLERKRMEEEVIAQREAGSPTRRRGGKRVYLTQEERQMVRDKTALEKARRKREKSEGARGRKRRNEDRARTGPACTIQGSLDGAPVLT